MVGWRRRRSCLASSWRACPWGSDSGVTPDSGIRAPHCLSYSRRTNAGRWPAVGAARETGTGGSERSKRHRPVDRADLRAGEPQGMHVSSEKDQGDAASAIWDSQKMVASRTTIVREGIADLSLRGTAVVHCSVPPTHAAQPASDIPVAPYCSSAPPEESPPHDPPPLRPKQPRHRRKHGRA